MIPVIALVGRPNVGKSTLFNQLTKSRDALVADYSGLTRDRKYGEGRLGEQRFMVIDTGGITGEEQGIDAAMAAQSLAAIDEADVVACGHIVICFMLVCRLAAAVLCAAPIDTVPLLMHALCAAVAPVCAVPLLMVALTVSS